MRGLGHRPRGSASSEMPLLAFSQAFAHHDCSPNIALAPAIKWANSKVFLGVSPDTRAWLSACT
jgi:hypothetical protein